MKNYITIDGGTTNTRINLITDRVIRDTVKLNIGARAGIDDKDLLKKQIKDGIFDILCRNNVKADNIIKILAAGMITSEFGLYSVEHICVPAGINELHNSMCEVVLNDICDTPFIFIRGVRSGENNLDKLQTTDMMRGEETELIGIRDIENIDGDCVFVLPGSHSKIIMTDKYGRISEFSTMLTGEMIAALSQNTILKDAVDLSVNETDDEYLLRGYNYCSKFGINESLFKVRVLKNNLRREKKEVYSFFLGVVLCDEIKRILETSASKIAIGGRKQIKEPTAKILEAVCDKDIIKISDKTVEYSTSIGMICIYEC